MEVMEFVRVVGNIYQRKDQNLFLMQSFVLNAKMKLVEKMLEKFKDLLKKKYWVILLDMDIMIKLQKQNLMQKILIKVQSFFNKMKNMDEYYNVGEEQDLEEEGYVEPVERISNEYYKSTLYD